MTTSVRAAEPGDLMHVARIWEQDWPDAHSGFVSPWWLKNSSRSCMSAREISSRRLDNRADPARELIGMRPRLLSAQIAFSLISSVKLGACGILPSHSKPWR